MAGPNRFSAPCGCCECPQTLCVTAKCGDLPTAINGVTVTVTDEDDIVIGECVTGRLATGYAASFDGTNYLQGSAYNYGAGTMTALWAKPANTTGLKTIASKTDEWWIFQDGSDVVYQVQTNVGLQTVRATGALSAGAWTHIVAGLSGVSPRLRIYINGSLAGSGDPTGTSGTATKEFLFASSAESWSHTMTSDPTPDDGQTIGSWESSDGDPASGCLQTLTSSLSDERVGYWEWSGTWESLDVPSGATISAVRMEEIRTNFYTGTNDTEGLHPTTVSWGPLTVRDSGGALKATLWSGRAATGDADDVWETDGPEADQTTLSGITASNASIRLRMADMVRGENLGLGVGIRTDTIKLAITYGVASVAQTTTSSAVAVGKAEGELEGDTPANYAGDVDEMFIFFSSTITALATYAAGAGICAPKLASGIQASWTLDEASGTRYATKGGPNLSDTGGVDQAAGKVAACYDTSGGCCMTLDLSPPETLTVEGTKAGYHGSSGTASVTYPNCNTSRNVSISLCPDTWHFEGTIRSCGSDLSPVEGATVTISGDVSGSDTTDAAGFVSFDFDISGDGNCLLDYSVSITPPGGHGMASLSYSRINQSGCTDQDLSGGLSEDTATHSNVCCGGKYVPLTVNYSDDVGSATLTFVGGLGGVGSAWVGTYSYSSNCKFDIGACGGPVANCLIGQAGSLNVEVRLQYDGTNWRVVRTVGDFPYMLGGSTGCGSGVGGWGFSQGFSLATINANGCNSSTRPPTQFSDGTTCSESGGTQTWTGSYCASSAYGCDGEICIDYTITGTP